MTDSLIHDFPRYQRMQMAKDVLLILLADACRRGNPPDPIYLAQDAFDYVDRFIDQEAAE
jgi:hypothetical protein